jgi:hypothetical protein
MEAQVLKNKDGARSGGLGERSEKIKNSSKKPLALVLSQVAIKTPRWER